jgi:hypothetical protein
MRCSGRSSSPLPIKTPRSIVFSSSRTFPGQGCANSRFHAWSEIRCMAFRILAAKAFKKIVGKQGNVVFPFPQRWNRQRNDVQPIKQIFPEATGFDRLFHMFWLLMAMTRAEIEIGRLFPSLTISRSCRARSNLA